MRDEIKRLRRMSAAQMELSRLLEVRLISARRTLEDIELTRAGIMTALDRAGPAGLTLYATATRRLADLASAKADGEQVLIECTSRLIEARSRQDVLQRHVRQLKSAEERKSLEEEMQESALLLKATGKHDVMR